MVIWDIAKTPNREPAAGVGMAARPVRDERFRGWASLLPPWPNPCFFRSGGHPGTGDCSRCEFDGDARRGRLYGPEPIKPWDYSRLLSFPANRSLAKYPARLQP